MVIIRFGLLVAVFGFLIGGAWAQKDGEDCAKITKDSARLECYDLIFKKTKIAGSASGVGKWNVREDVSKFDDSRSVYLTLTSEDKHPGQFGGLKASYIMITCRENTTSVWISFADMFMSSDAGDGSVTYRLDSEGAKSRSFVESNDNSVLGLWRGSSSIPFIKELIGHEQLVVRATPFSESSVTATFDIRGLDSALEPLRDACHW